LFVCHNLAFRGDYQPRPHETLDISRSKTHYQSVWTAVGRCSPCSDVAAGWTQFWAQWHHAVALDAANLT